MTQSLAMRRRLAKLWPGVWPATCFAVSAIVAIPLLTVLASVFQSSDGEWQHLAETRLGDYVRNTLWLAVSVVTITLVVGTATAWLIETCDFPGRKTFRWMLLLPLAVPAYLSAYAYTDLLQFSGPVQTSLREAFGWGRRDYWFPEVRSVGGAAVILALSLFPYVYVAARTAFAEHAASAMEVGRTLGRGPWRCFLTVALPLARPALAAGGALVLMETLADFGAADYCAVDTFATGIYRTWRGLESPVAAAQLSAVLLGVVSLLVLVDLLARRHRRFHGVSRTSRPMRKVRLGWRSATAAIVVCGLPVVLGFVLPALIFGHMAWTAGDARAREVVLDFGFNTLWLAAASGVIAGGLALLVAFGRRVSKSRTVRSAGRFAGLGYALPGTVVAIGVLVPLGWLDHAFNDATRTLFDWRPGLIFTGSVLAVMLAYQTRFLGVALGMVESGMTRIRRNVDDAARSLGTSGGRLLVRIHLPLLRGSLLAAMLLVFVDVAKELPATLMLRPFDFETLAVRVYQLASDERLEEASLGALAIIGVGLLPVIVLSGLLESRRRSQTHA
ncbi:MAG: iron ABC transporter permease [Planctomycetota bacterium]